MCGRYYVDDDTADKIHRITKNADLLVRTGDIRPSEAAAVFLQRNGMLAGENMVWGYPGYQGNNLLINASVSPIHSRMPLLLSEKELEGWLFDENMMKTALTKIPQTLNRRTDFEQLSFFF